MDQRISLAFLFIFGLAWSSPAQLPADAVDLSKVKITEIQKSADLCPVYLELSDPTSPTWSYKGVEYRGAKPGAKEKFFQEPDQYAKAAEKARFINNFMLSMSTIWCPVTDQVTPGNMKQWKKLGYTWESCCGFCDENAKEQDFQDGLDRLRKRAEETYNLIGAKYATGAKSPVEGAIKRP